VFQLLVIETARQQERQAVVAFIRAWANAAAPWKRITRELLQVAAAIEGWGAGGAPPPGSAATGPAPAGRAADAPNSQPDPHPPSPPLPPCLQSASGVHGPWTGYRSVREPLRDDLQQCQTCGLVWVIPTVYLDRGAPEGGA